MTATETPRVVLLPLPTVEPDCLCGDPKHDKPCRRACSCQRYRPNTNGGQR